MATDSFKFRLGVFVLTGLALGIGGFISIGAARVLEDWVPVHFYFRQSVQGLDRGSEIKYLGVNVGRVTDVRMAASKDSLLKNPKRRGGDEVVIHVTGELDPERLLGRIGGAGTDPEELEDIFRVAGTFGLRAQIQRASLTSGNHVELAQFDPQEYPQPSLPLKPEQPYVPTASDATLADIQRDVGRAVANLAVVDFEEISDRLLALMDGLSGEVESLELEELSGDARATMKALRELAESKELTAAVKRTENIAASLEKATGRFEELMSREELDTAVTDLAASAAAMNRAMQQVDERMPGLLRELEGAVGDARTAIADADVPAISETLQSAAGDVGGAARSVTAMREDVRRTLRDVSEAARSLAELARLLEERPDAMLTGKRPRGGGE